MLVAATAQLSNPVLTSSSYHYVCWSQADRFNLQSQLEHLQSKHIGTGHADLTK